MKRSRKIILISILILVVFGLWWMSRTGPKPEVFQVDLSRRTIIQIYPNPDDIIWFGIKWTDDGKYIEIYNSRAQVYASKLMRIDPKNPLYSNGIQTREAGNILGVVNELPFKLEDKESLWAGCEKGSLFFTAKYLEIDGSWETRLWKGGQLIKTFPPMKFNFGMYESSFNDDPVGWTIEYSHFSPDCRYDVLTFGKDVWLLDTVKKTFTHIFEARQQFPSSLNDIFEPKRQFVWPAWAPDSHEFAFGDWEFGIEKYDVQSDERSWLSAPGVLSGVLKWSKTSNWILGYTSVISSNGHKTSTLTGCEDIQHPSWSSENIHTDTEDHPAWSPVDDKVAFICSQYDQSTCTDGKCERDESFLVIWDLSNLDSN
jgi:hypothetical protein